MSKQNAIDLARTARSEAESIQNGTKRTIMQIIENWNECVKQAGFMCIYDFPTTGYTRKSQLAADLLRCADQLDEYVEPNPHAAKTVEQQTREFNAACTRILDTEVAHVEAIRVNYLNNMFKNFWSLNQSDRMKWFSNDYDDARKIEFELNAIPQQQRLETSDTWQTRGRGSNDQEYQIYRSCADDGKGNEFMTGNPLKTYEQWLRS
ncbi:hypothetical protein ORL88_12155 [Klebsiella oxytoca]|uniref:hypothetical protein n=1 Tax=Klebsiella oxytoca TaxID=571 RepID=UPI0007CD0960|nr:hypothetical protein [Klebsiella oxytoca]MCW9590787.1 hypothetical protein [Klebsiella oxytoca]MCW9605381.1 hypothetical protein [Klebsiella oxytoca]MCW9624925.1 hypothetical protein [Klebsiella oxytoca]SAQ49809.1 Uncharacterised protein [Klebsiella oxytoca]